MSARSFAIPCTVCHHGPDAHLHGDFEYVPSTTGPRSPHAYVADTASPEYATAKLREALEAARTYLLGIWTAVPDAGAMAEGMREMDKALAIADAAGITSESIK